MSSLTPPSRISSLDGLRGAASLVVLAHHALLTMSGFAAVYWGLPTPGFVAPFAFTPLHVIWAGPEAVLVFFVLSGVVLTLPAIRRGSIPWIAYYPSRLIRLYLPVAFAVGFALVLARIWPRTADGRFSPWIQMHNEAPTLSSAFHNAVLLNGTTWLNSPLWSLQWEVWFSLLLPVYVLLALRWGRNLWLPIGCLLVALVITGDLTGIAALRYLPYFGLGALIAANLDSLGELSQKFNRTGRSVAVQVALIVTALLLLTFRWWPGNLLPSPLSNLSSAPIAAGAVGIVLIAVCVPAARAVFSTRAFVAVGTISFSLYLVHEPILVTIALATPPDMSWIAPVVGIPLSLIVSWLFYVLIEKGTHRLSRWVARRITGDVVTRPSRVTIADDR